MNTTWEHYQQYLSHLYEQMLEDVSYGDYIGNYSR